jgi:hypothetical protein
MYHAIAAKKDCPAVAAGRGSEFRTTPHPLDIASIITTQPYSEWMNALVTRRVPRVRRVSRHAIGSASLDPHNHHLTTSSLCPAFLLMTFTA